MSVARPILLAIGLWLGTVGAASALCRVSGRFHIHHEGPWPYRMQVSSGTDCGHIFHYAGPVVFKRLYVPEHPSSGVIKLREGGHYAYASRPGYRGPDRFTLRICGIAGNGASHCANLAYTVSVQ